MDLPRCRCTGPRATGELRVAGSRSSRTGILFSPARSRRGTVIRTTRDQSHCCKRHFALLGSLVLALSCTNSPAEDLTDRHRGALADTVATLFDSLAAIHRDQPDTGLLRRLHSPGDSIQFVEGAVTEVLTGDSLFRRVRALHRPVHAMTQRFADRSVLVLDVNHAVLTAAETVDWTDTAGPHHYAGLLTIVASRRGAAWLIRSYRGS